MARAKHFYSYLVDTVSIEVELDTLELTMEEKEELTVIMDTTIHHVVVDTVLSELSPADKKSFLSHMMHEKHDEIWQLLRERMHEPEAKITKAVHSLKEEMHGEIRESKEAKAKQDAEKDSR